MLHLVFDQTELIEPQHLRVQRAVAPFRITTPHLPQIGGVGRVLLTIHGRILQIAAGKIARAGKAVTGSGILLRLRHEQNCLCRASNGHCRNRNGP